MEGCVMTNGNGQDVLSHEDLSQWNSRQLEEALGDDNKHFFRQTHGRDPIDTNELILHYIRNGGADNFDKRNKNGTER